MTRPTNSSEYVLTGEAFADEMLVASCAEGDRLGAAVDRALAALELSEETK